MVITEVCNDQLAITIDKKPIYCFWWIVNQWLNSQFS